MSDLSEDDIIRELELALSQMVFSKPKDLEFRVYYDDVGHIITYTTEDLPGNYLVITRDDYNLARHDARIHNGKLFYTHLAKTVLKMTKSESGTYRVNKLDISVIEDDDCDDVITYSVLPYEEEYSG